MKGKEYEDVAAAFLRRKGYQIITRNYRTRFGEIDIVAKFGKTLIFVEVKGGKKDPRFRMTRGKFRKIELAANHFLKTHDVPHSEIRLDVIEVSDRGVEHIEGVSL